MMMMTHAAAVLSSCSPQVGAAGVAVSTVGNAKWAAPQKSAALQPRISFRRPPQSRLLGLRAEPNGKSSDEYVDYEGRSSVFPAEECEDTGENCDAVGVFKEVSPKASAASVAPPEDQSGPAREYEEYSGAKTVFPGEACDELGGEFCEPEFQAGVFPDKVKAAKQ